MLALLVEAYMADDHVSYRAAIDWLIAYAHQVRARSGRVKHGRAWFDPARYDRLLATVRRNRERRWQAR